MNKTTQSVIDTLKQNYGIDVNEEDVSESDSGAEYINIKNKLYTVYPGLDQNSCEEIASYVYNDTSDVVEEGITNVSSVGAPIAEDDEEGTKPEKDKLYKYHFDDEVVPEEGSADYELMKISEFDPYCKVLMFYGNGRIAEVNFDIPENEDKNLPYTGEYSVYTRELTEVPDSKEKVKEDINSGSVPPEILPLDESYPSLLVALDSERDAEVTYKTLIEIEESTEKPNQEVIDLLKKILADELEHIALLSALQANKNSEFVADDSKQEFNDYVSDAVTTEE